MRSPWNHHRIFPCLTEKGTNFCDYLVDGNRGQAFFAFDDAGLEAAAPAIGLMVDDAMLFAIGKPDARFVTRSEDSNAGSLNGCGQMHGAAIVPNERAGSREDSSAFACGQEAT